MSQIIEKLLFDYYGIKPEIKNRKIKKRCTIIWKLDSIV